MSGIPVIVVPPTAPGRLYPRYINRAGIFVIQSRLPRPCPHGVNIDGRVILDFGEDRILVGVEVLGRPFGKGKMEVTRPSATPGDIRLGEALTGSSEYDWPIFMSYDVQQDIGRISFDEGDFDRAVALSDTASALLRGDNLIGFWFSLAR